MFVYLVSWLIGIFSCFSQASRFFYGLEQCVLCGKSFFYAIRIQFIWTNTQFPLPGTFLNNRIEDVIFAHIYCELAAFFLVCLKILFSITRALSSLSLAWELLFPDYQLELKKKKTTQTCTSELHVYICPIIISSCYYLKKSSPEEYEIWGRWSFPSTKHWWNHI